MPANRAGGPCICCKACSNAITVGMPSMGNASARVPAKANRAPTPITAVWAQTRIALAANGSVRIPRYGPIWWTWRSGRVCTLLAHPERLAEEYRRRLQPETGAKRPLWSRSKARSANCARALHA